jgi:hypothetical protein
MSSGVEFGKTQDGQRDLNRLWIDMVAGLGPTKGAINSMTGVLARAGAPEPPARRSSSKAAVKTLVIVAFDRRPAGASHGEHVWRH